MGRASRKLVVQDTIRNTHLYFRRYLGYSSDRPVITHSTKANLERNETEVRNNVSVTNP